MSLAPPSASPLIPGYRLDRYELICPIADGGMAQIWVARLRGKHGFEKLVAIKSILPKYAADPQFQRMFLDEARIASGIQHANVAQIFDLGEEHGVLYLAMEWVEGHALNTLHKTLGKQGQAIPIGVLLRIMADTCAGLHAAHELRGKDGALLNVVHRDVSPQNIIVSSRGVTKLIDFGIAKARDRTADETSSGMLKGKVHYMAPEQAVGGVVDRRADIWAIGAIAYHLLSGKPPFDGPNQIATLHQLLLGKPPEPLPDSVPPPVAAVILRALSHDRDKRQATAAEVQAALESAMVSSNLVTTTAEVGAFTEKVLGDRGTKRREAIDIALAAAAERERVHELLKPAGDGSFSSAGGPGAAAAAAGAAAAAAAASAAVAERQSQGTVPLRAMSPGDRIPPPPSVPTASSLGLESPIAPPAKRSVPTAVLIGAVAAIGAAVGIAGTMALRSGGAAQAPALGASGGQASNAAVILPPAPPSAEVAAASTGSTVQRQAQAPTSSASTAAAPPTSPRATPTARPPSVARGTSGAAAATTTKIPKVLDNGF